jgi:peptidyl-prolyl cis-trans isomerase B (cyclophilin B)
MNSRPPVPHALLPKMRRMPKRYPRAEQVIDSSLRYQATITTDRGDIVIDLDQGRAPKTVNNFVFLARDGFYDGLTFHRVVDDFVIQGGCPEGSGRGNPGYRFEDEPVVGEYVPGAVAMANSGPNTNGSQFFICTVDDSRKLAKSYNLFGQVVSGMDIVTGVHQGDVMRKVAISETAAE